MTTSEKITASSGETFQEASLNFNTWIDLLYRRQLSIQDQALIVKGLQDHHEWVNQSNSYQQTPLMIVTLRGCIEVVQAFIQAGANLNSQDQWEWTALMYACERGPLEVVQLLIDAGANLDLQNQKGWSALMWAADRGNVEIVQALIHQGADLNVKDYKGWTAVECAKNKGHDNVVGYLEAYTEQQALSQAILTIDQSSLGLRSGDTEGRDSSKKPRL